LLFASTNAQTLTLKGAFFPFFFWNVYFLFFAPEPLHALPLARLLALSCDELGYFVSTYTHMICYGAMVLSHALLSTPASAVAVFFVLAMAALQAGT